MPLRNPFAKQPPRRTRRRVKTIDEREREAQLRLQREAIQTLRQADPEGYRKILIDRALSELGVSSRRRDSGGNNTGGMGFLAELMNSELAVGLGQSLGQAFASRMGAAPLPPPPPTPALSAPTLVATPPRPEPAPPVTTPPGPALPGADVPMTPDSQWFVDQVQGRTPEELAELFLSLRLPIVQEICREMAKATDDQLPILWWRVEQVSPHIAGFSRWFQQQDVYLPTVHAVRLRMAAQIAAGSATLH